VIFLPYIEPEVIEQARQIDLLTYLQAFEPHELVRISGNNYTTRTHDSLKISNGKWMWWSRRIGGYNALDYLVKVKGCSFVEAVETLMGKAAVMPSLTVRPKQEEKPKVLLLPEKSASNDRITEYLFGRGIANFFSKYQKEGSFRRSLIAGVILDSACSKIFIRVFMELVTCCCPFEKSVLLF